ncbi:hypothetical protein NFI96_024831, partial [Prochilodus magdalenae]
SFSLPQCLLVLNGMEMWLSGGNELCVWNRDFQLQCKSVHHRDAGITAMVELPKSYIAAAMDKEIVIFKLSLSEVEKSVFAIRHLADHQDTIRTLICINDGLFASGSHNGELIFWDAVDWTIQGYELILWEESAGDAQSEIRVGQQRQTEMSIQHLATDGELVIAAVGSGLYVYNALMKTVVAYRKTAHDSDVLHTMLLDNSGVVPDCHGVTQNGSGSSSVTSPALVLVETPNESVCGGTVVSTKMNVLSHVQKAWCHSTSTPTAPSAGTVQVISCSEDGSVRIWELQDLPLPAEPASSGFFGMFGTFGRSSKQAGAPAKKLLEVSDLRSLELIGDLIGHSGAVQMFVSFGEKGLVTCSADHLLIVWKDGERESQMRSLALFQKLEELQGL